MTANPQWPASLPQCPLANNYAENRRSNVISTSIPTGIDKMRRRTTYNPTNFAVVFQMSTAQVAKLDEFYYEILQEVGRFDWFHPRTQEPATCRIRTAPEKSHTDGDYYQVSFTLEVL